MGENETIYKMKEMYFPREIYFILKTIGDISKTFNRKIYLTGGYIRDALLNIRSQDLDFVTTNLTSSYIEAIHKALGGNLEINSQFMTVKIYFPNNINIDIVHSRKEFYQDTGSLPTIQKGNLLDDLMRRDFSVNTLLLDVEDMDNLKIIDYLNGIQDLKKREIKILHGKSFVDDPTRLFRAIRLSMRLGFKIECNTLVLLKKGIKEQLIYHLSYDRIFKEILKTLKESNSHQILEVYKKYKMLEPIFDTGIITNDILNKIEALENNFKTLKQDLGLGQAELFKIKLLLLFHRIEKERLHFVLNRISLKSDIKNSILKMNKEHKDLIKEVLNSYQRYDNYKIFQRLNHEEIILLVVISNLNTKLIDEIKYYCKISSKMGLKVSGSDLMELGLSEGPKIGRMLEILRREVVNNDIKGKKQQIQIAQELIQHYERRGLN